jgi:hypothetical protein
MRSITPMTLFGKVKGIVGSEALTTEILKGYSTVRGEPIYSLTLTSRSAALYAPMNN